MKIVIGICSVAGCGKKGRLIRKMCGKHYMRVCRGNSVHDNGRINLPGDFPDPRPGYRGNYGVNTVDDVRNKAKRRKKEWKLTVLQAYNLLQGDCTYCGSLANWPTSRNGIDRVDSTVGYTATNCVSCCTRCNSAKNDMTIEGFIAWIKKVYQFNTKQK